MSNKNNGSNKIQTEIKRCSTCTLPIGNEGIHLHAIKCVKYLRKTLQHQSIGVDTACINFGQQLERTQVKAGNLRDALAVLMLRHLTPHANVEGSKNIVHEFTVTQAEIDNLNPKSAIAFLTPDNGKGVTIKLTVPGVGSTLPS